MTKRICTPPLVQALAGGILLCSWARPSTLTVPLSTQVYKWVPANCWGNLTNYWEMTKDGLASRPGGVGILLASSCYKNRDKLQQLWARRLQGFTFCFPLVGMLASPLQGYPRWYICQYPFIHLGGEKHCESKVPLNTMYLASAQTRTAQFREIYVHLKTLPHRPFYQGSILGCFYDFLFSCHLSIWLCIGNLRKKKLVINL